MESAWGPTAEEMESVGFNLIASLLLDLAQKLGGKRDFKIVNFSGFKTGEVAVGISTVAVETTTGTVEAFNHTRSLKRLKVLIN